MFKSIWEIIPKLVNTYFYFIIIFTIFVKRNYMTDSGAGIALIICFLVVPILSELLSLIKRK
jgi:hypothetical protein